MSYTFRIATEAVFPDAPIATPESRWLTCQWPLRRLRPRSRRIRERCARRRKAAS